MQTACYWQFCFSDRFTGARNPARLFIAIQSRRSRCAPCLRLTMLREYRTDLIVAFKNNTVSAAHRASLHLRVTVRDVVIGMSDGLTKRFTRAFRPPETNAGSSVIALGGLAKKAAGRVATIPGGFLAACTVSPHCGRLHSAVAQDPDSTVPPWQASFWNASAGGSPVSFGGTGVSIHADRRRCRGYGVWYGTIFSATQLMLRCARSPSPDRLKPDVSMQFFQFIVWRPLR